MNGFSLEEIDGRLSLIDLENPKVSPVTVDFCSNAILHRLRHGLSRNQPLPRALGVRAGAGGVDISVLDLTAGLGTDAFFIAALGCRVRAVERSPVVAQLLADGYRRLLLSEEPLLREIASRLSFEQGEALAALDSGAEFGVIYMDPMYPEESRTRTALPKKGMQFFRRLIGDDVDAAAVFARARELARERVVVKRPSSAPPLAANPTHVFEGKTARFDMYLCR